MLEDKMKERDGSYGCCLCQKQNKRHDVYVSSMLEDKMKECDGLYMCRLCWKTKRKNVTYRIIYAKNKTRDMTDCIGIVYVRR